MRAGDLVISYDINTKQLKLDQVRQLLQFQVDQLVHITLNDQSILTTTVDHPLFLPDQQLWACVDPKSSSLHQKCGDIVKLEPGHNLLKLESHSEFSVRCCVEKIEIEPLQFPTTVFTLTTAQFHNFFAENLLVHNKGDDSGPDVSKRSMTTTTTTATTECVYKYYAVAPGLNYEGKCENSDCKVYNENVITKRGFGEKIYPLMEEFEKKIKCPGCQTPFQVTCYNFYKCEVSTRDEKQVRSTSDRVEGKNILVLGDGGREVSCGYLTFTVTPL